MSATEPRPDETLMNVINALEHELAEARSQAAEALEQARRAVEIAEDARRRAGAHDDEAAGTRPGRTGGSATTTDAAAGAGDAGPSRPAAGAGDAGGGDDPLVDALTAYAEELRQAAEARRRGELDAREAIRLLRTGFHKARRVTGSLQRGERPAD